MYLVFSVGNIKEIFQSVDENKDGSLNAGELQRIRIRKNRPPPEQ